MHVYVKIAYYSNNEDCTGNYPVQGVKQSVCPSVIVIGTKIARFRVLGICACYMHRHNESVYMYMFIGEKQVSTRFKLLKMAY